MGHRHCSHKDSTVDCDRFKYCKHLMHIGSVVTNLGPKTNGSSRNIMSVSLIVRLATR